jgi:hypothetical protein
MWRSEMCVWISRVSFFLKCPVIRKLGKRDPADIFRVVDESCPGFWRVDMPGASTIGCQQDPAAVDGGSVGAKHTMGRSVISGMWRAACGTADIELPGHPWRSPPCTSVPRPYELTKANRVLHLSDRSDLRLP